MRLLIILLASWLVQSSFINNTVMMELGDHSFENRTLNGHGYLDWLVMFYTPSCPACPALFSTLNQTSLHLYSTQQSSVRVAVVNAHLSPRLEHRFAIQGYPYLILMSKGHMYEYSGLPEKESILNWLTHHNVLSESSPVPEQKSLRSNIYKSSHKVGVLVVTLLSTLVGMWVIFQCCARFEPEEGIK